MSFAIRMFKDSDGREIVDLFYETIHAVNIRDYTQEQVDAWAPKLSGSELEDRVKTFIKSLGESITYVADNEGVVIGFANITEDGYLDFMFVHKDYQGQGVASNLLQILQEEAIRLGVQRVWANVSITAKPFFERHGFVTVQAQTVKRRGVSINNFRMEKALLRYQGR